MDKMEWLELLEQAELARMSVSRGDIEMIIENVLDLVTLVYVKADDAAQHDGWYKEFDDFLDSALAHSLTR